MAQSIGQWSRGAAPCAASIGELVETPSIWAASEELDMSGLSEAIPFPALGERTRTRTRVDHKTSEEADLVRRIQAQDGTSAGTSAELAFREIVDRYQSKVFSIIYGVLRNHNDAEDIAQQVFSKVYFSIRNFDFRSSLLTWIYKITVNECYDYLRKKRVRKLVYESDFSEEDAQRMQARPGDETPLEGFRRGPQSDPFEGSRRPLRRGVGGDDRFE